MTGGRLSKLQHLAKVFNASSVPLTSTEIVIQSVKNGADKLQGAPWVKRILEEAEADGIIKAKKKIGRGAKRKVLYYELPYTTRKILAALESGLTAEDLIEWSKSYQNIDKFLHDIRGKHISRDIGII
jgi:hypothetical protein